MTTSPFEDDEERSAEGQAKDRAELERLWGLVSLPIGNFATLPEVSSRLKTMSQAKHDTTIVRAALAWLIANGIIAPGDNDAGEWFPIDIPDYMDVKP